MSVRAMSAHFFTSLHPCLTQSGTYDGVESRGWSDTHSHCSAQFTTLITPNISIERPDAYLADMLAKLPSCPPENLDALLPDRWQSANM